MNGTRWINALRRFVPLSTPNRSPVYTEMRRAMLDLAHPDRPTNLAPIGQNLLAVLVEIPGDGRHRSTLVCVSDGTTSLYHSKGAPVIRAGEIPTVRTLARELLEIAAGASRHDQDQWSRIRRKRLDTRFDFVTTEGVVTGYGDMDRPTEETAFLRLVHVCAQKVITEIRVTGTRRTTTSG